jgi:hypothetical protein
MSYKSKYFSDPISLSQLRCHCGCGKDDISPDLLRILDKLREMLDRPLNINSGCRCESHNAAIYRNKNSSYIKGLAVDIMVVGSSERFEVLSEIFAFNANADKIMSPFISQITRIGIAKNFIHIDIDPDKAQDVVWVY